MLKCILTKKSDIAMLMLSGSSMGSKGQGVYRETGDIGKAYDTGVTEGVKEYATERMFGGVTGLGKGLVPASISKSLTQNASTAVKGFLNTPAGQISKYLANAGGEGAEELIFQGLEVYVDRTYDAKAAKATKEELWQAAKVGGLVLLILGVGNINTKVSKQANNLSQGLYISANKEYNLSGGIENGYSSGIYERSGGGQNNSGLQSGWNDGRNNQGVDRGLRVLISPDVDNALTQKGYTPIELKNSSSDPAVFSDALKRSIDNNRHGGYVEYHTKDKLISDNVKQYLTQDGMSGIGVWPDGNTGRLLIILLGGIKVDCRN